MVNEFAMRLIEQSGEETTDALFGEEHAGVFVVDYREADEDIIDMAANALGTSALSSEWQDEKLHVRYVDQLTLVPLVFEPGEQDKTLLAINRAIAADYEVRFIKASDGGDTLYFMALPTNEWADLESRFGTGVDEAFMKLANDSSLFS